VGKELIAAAVHYRSRRRAQLFVSQNCAAMPENLLESELFGHKKGSFTGAHEDKKGLFEIADGGTLFLDEVTEMPMSLQSKLLRVLQEGEIRAIGATQEKRVNVRIVAATNRNMEKEVKEGRFREDLYYRLSVFPIRVPPLRERREDIPLLAESFLERYSTEVGKPAAGYSQQTMELLQAYDWPGNVRELFHVVERAAVMCSADVIDVADLPPALTRAPASPAVATDAFASFEDRPMRDAVAALEKHMIARALEKAGGNRAEAARLLGIARPQLYTKMDEHGLGDRDGKKGKRQE